MLHPVNRRRFHAWRPWNLLADLLARSGRAGGGCWLEYRHPHRSYLRAIHIPLILDLS